MDTLLLIIDWLDDNEGVFSALAAILVILGVVYTAWGKSVMALLRPSKPDAPQSAAAPASATPPALSPDAGAAVPSVVVLPFVTQAGQDGDDVLADAIADEIMATLSAGRGIQVIARNTAFTYKGKAVDARQIGADLNVGYVLEGSLQRAGDRLRITARLDDARTGTQIWAGKFDTNASDLFEVQDEIARKIVTQLASQFAIAESVRASAIKPEDMTAWTLTARAMALVTYTTGADNIAQGEAMLRKALALDPDYPLAQALLAQVVAGRGNFGSQLDAQANRDEAKRAADQALALAPDDPRILMICAVARGLLGEVDEGIQLLTRALELDPHSATARSRMALLLVWKGQPDQAIPHVKQAISLSPNDPLQWSWWGTLAQAELSCGNLDAAAEAARKSCQLGPRNPRSQAVLAGALAYQGRMDEAAKAIARLQELAPGVTADRLGEVMIDILHIKPDLAHAITEALARAGLPIRTGDPDRTNPWA